MTQINWEAERQSAIHLLRSGLSPSEVAAQMGHAVSWVCKCRDRYAEAGWAGLKTRSHAPHTPGNAYKEAVRQAVCQTRSVLEARAAEKSALQYIGAAAIRGELLTQQQQGIYTGALPSTATMERMLRAAHLTHPRQAAPEEVHYPHLQPTEPHTLIQVDIVPHYLRGGTAVACFNALDVVSRYPTGQALAHRRAVDAADFLLHTWQTLGIPQYTQVDNEGCFSGGFTHPYVLGKVVRLALLVGTELLFSPYYHPASNGSVERFHQDYNAHVWTDTELTDIPAVQQGAEDFFAQYRNSRHHTALAGHTPAEIHQQTPPRYLAADFADTQQKLSLVPGRVHFLRQVSAARTVKILNHDWEVPAAELEQGVWATLEITSQGATLTIYNAAPDQQQRTCLARHTFPLTEPVCTREAVLAQTTDPTPLPVMETLEPHSPTTAVTLATPLQRCALLPQPPAVLPLAWVVFIVSTLRQRQATASVSRCRDG
jgi:transposase InsO family protein